jgi:hypothetical protein
LVELGRVAIAHQVDLRENWPRFWVAVREPLRQIVNYGFQSAGIVLICMTPVFLMLRLRRPRPPWRVLLVQPGMVAALAMVFGLLWVTGLVHILLPGLMDAFTMPWIAVGGSVAVAWVALVLLRRWKAERGWVDRMGRLMGAMAIGTALLGFLVYRV